MFAVNRQLDATNLPAVNFRLLVRRQKKHVSSKGVAANTRNRQLTNDDTLQIVYTRLFATKERTKEKKEEMNTKNKHSANSIQTKTVILSYTEQN